MRTASLTHGRAKSMRNALTPPELALWVRLRTRGEGQPVFRRQHPFGPYVLDFYCAKARLAIEVDGQSHDMGDRHAHDAGRDAYLDGKGVRVMRYRAVEVMVDPDGVAQAIIEAAGAWCGCSADAD
jgi:very-short-patch-repair endonuclease